MYYKATREQVSQKLQGIENLIMPLTIRIAPLSPNQIIEAVEASGLEFPVLIREIGVHGGKTTYLLKNADEVRQLYALALDGQKYYLTQFYDYQEDGVYKKYRLVVIDGQAYFRNLGVKDHWMVHRTASKAFMNQNPRYDKEEKYLIENFDKSLKLLIQSVITEIYKRIPLDYFGIDCNINKKSKICLF